MHSFGLSVVLLLVASVSGHREYLDYVPNLYDPYFSRFAHGAVGHTTEGGSPLNAFGRDFADAAYHNDDDDDDDDDHHHHHHGQSSSKSNVWQSSLCCRDSDGDGLRNGEELGDPCCIWEYPVRTQSPITSFNVSHPGISSEVTTDPRRQCPHDPCGDGPSPPSPPSNKTAIGFALCPVTGANVTAEQYANDTSPLNVYFKGGQRIATATLAAANRFRSSIPYYVDTGSAENPGIDVTPRPALVGHNVTGPVTGAMFTVQSVSAGGDGQFREQVVQMEHNQSLFFANYESVVDFLAFPSKFLA